MNNTPVDTWMHEAVHATTEVVTQMLGWESVPADGAGAGSPFADPLGAYVPMTSTNSMVQLGLVAEREACHAMSRALLGMADDEPFGADSDVTDAVGEIANMIAGGLKTRLNASVPGIQLGLPLCLSETPGGSPGIEHAVSTVRLGTVLARVVVLRRIADAPSSRRR